MPIDTERLFAEAMNPPRGRPLCPCELEKLAATYERDVRWVRIAHPDEAPRVLDLVQRLRDRATALRISAPPEVTA